jgi:hypothetical protein
MFKFSTLSASYKIAFAVSVFFLVNAIVSMNIVLLPSFASYIIGFSVGIASGFAALQVHKRRTDFDANDVQIEVAIELVKQLSAMNVKTATKAVPADVLALIYAAKAHFPEAAKPLQVEGTQTDTDFSGITLC